MRYTEPMFEYRHKKYTAKQLAEMNHIPYMTLMNRLKMGYSTEEATRLVMVSDSVLNFMFNVKPETWDGLSCDELYELYLKDYEHDKWGTFVNQRTFIRQIKEYVDDIKIVPTKRVRDGKAEYVRVVRTPQDAKMEGDTNG